MKTKTYIYKTELEELIQVQAVSKSEADIKVVESNVSPRPCEYLGCIVFTL